MGKAAENEKLKLRATFLNNVATSVIITGFIVPYYAIISGMFEAGTKAALVRGAPCVAAWSCIRERTDQLIHDPRIWLLLILTGFSVLVARIFRGGAMPFWTR
ncbi:hypothetical protein ACFIOY_40170 [Bradyrhizobium sp. TZ2]